MVVVAAGGEVGAGQTRPGKVRAVRAAADGHAHGYDAVCAEGILRALDEVEVRQDLFLHVVVAVGDGDLGGAVAVDLVDLIGAGSEKFLLFFKLLAVVVADDVAQRGLCHAALHVREMEEALVALGLLGYFILGQQRVEVHRHGRGVDHHVLGAAGVDAHAVHRQDGGGGVEVFIFDLAEGAAIRGVAVVAAKLLHVEPVRAVADLLVGREDDAHLAVAEVLFEDRLHRGHDLGDARLIVRAEQRRAVGHDQLIAHVVFKAGTERFGEGNVVVELELAALVAHEAGLDVLARGVGRGIHVRDERNDGRVHALARGERCEHIAAIVHVNVLKAERFKLLHQNVSEVLLPLRGGRGAGEVIRGGVVADIAQKTRFGRFHF